ncbi:MAG: YhcH/YjgK/YiaL family protein [Ignavibacteriaceae bacterium]|nr:YhcH/YjgK/YiaL family protein [Ignavibacteriaceae bacterium]
MIIDKLSNSSIYESVNPLLKKGFEFLSRKDLASLEPGKYEIDGDKVFAIVAHYDTKDYVEGKWESHRKYLDIQFMVEGIEFFGYNHISNLTLKTEYSDENDIIFYDGHGSMIPFSKDDFIVVFPEDAHYPSLKMPGSSNVIKIIVKVAVNKEN